MFIHLAPQILNVDCRRNGLQLADSVDWIGFRVCRGLPVEIGDFEPQASLPRSGPQQLYLSVVEFRVESRRERVVEGPCGFCIFEAAPGPIRPPPMMNSDGVPVF